MLSITAIAVITALAAAGCAGKAAASGGAAITDASAHDGGTARQKAGIGKPGERGKPDVSWYTHDPGAQTITIRTGEELAGLAAIVNGTWGGTPRSDSFEGKTVKLAGDIDLTAFDNWVPIGIYNYDTRTGADRSLPFSGTFDGGGYVINDLKINRPGADCQGLFGYIRKGEVAYLGLNDANVRGRDFTGGIAGIIANHPSIVNGCHVIGRIAGASGVGGLVGHVISTSVVSNGYSSAEVSGAENIGGIAGYVSESAVANCYSTGAVSGTERVGGVAGTALKSSVFANYSICIVSGSRIVGGVTGFLSEYANVTNSAALNPYVRGEEDVGRVVGKVVQPSSLINNAAYGEGLTPAAIMTDKTIGGRFLEASGWTVRTGSLPGHGKTVEMPPHLREDPLAAAAAPAGGSGVSLIEAVELSANKIASELPKGSRVAVLAFESENASFSEFMVEELTGALVDRGIEVADRQNLELLQKELKFQMSGSVSDDDIKAAGKFLAADMVITGLLVNIGEIYRYQVNAIRLEQATRASVVRLSVRNDAETQGIVDALAKLRSDPGNRQAKERLKRVRAK
ncbi:MAG: hypothetical protein FWB85_12200 [Chitinispirillia bacterium]|nr:hypothetical protein [Chitinispirillia bacterium]MCL2242831.1 hypothetical protein [Chitinispirillia bacterium]